MHSLRNYISLWAAAACLCLAACQGSRHHTSLPAGGPEAVRKHVVLDAGLGYQQIEGFGVNVTPAQWRGGGLRGPLDTLVDDLGATLFRFDCYGRADWLDPARRRPDGTFPDEYLRQVYTGPVFGDAWAAFRHLNARGLEPILNISGLVPLAWAEKEGAVSRRLVDFDAYAEMAVSLLQWAREKEKLRFSRFMPFNETDIGRVEGPLVRNEDCVRATRAVWQKMQARGFGDVRLIVMDDASPSVARAAVFGQAPELAPAIAAFGMHTYGDGLYGDGHQWHSEESPYARIRKTLSGGPFRDTPLWLTEYGDLDQSGEIEFTFAWLSTRRLLRFLNDGGAAALAWDGYDNYHVHDSTWATYGLLRTDTAAWNYTPKHRYHAARQVYRFVRPGFRRIGAAVPDPGAGHVYAEWTHPGRHLLLSAYAAPDKAGFTLVGMNNVEGDVELDIDLRGFGAGLEGRAVQVYLTSRTQMCRRAATVPVRQGRLAVSVPERCIFTLTTLQAD